MADKDNLAVEFVFPVPRVMLYAHLITPRKFKDPKTGREGDPRFEASFLLPVGSDDQKAAVAAASKAASLLYPGRDLKTLHFPFKKAEDVGEKDRERATGHIVLATKTPRPAKLSIIQNGKVIDLPNATEDERAAAAKHFFRGAEVYASINFKAYEGMGDGVTAYLQHILSTGKGEKIAGGRSGSEVFGGYIGITSDEDPTSGTGLEGII